MAFKYAVALTGSIATGKSAVSRVLQEEGYEVIDADSIAHTILNEQKDTIAKMFGKELLLTQGIDRKALGAMVFADEKKRKQLESLLHPLIYERIVALSQILDAKKHLYFVDIPLFFEGKRYPIQKVLVVYTSNEKQLHRLMQRDNSTKTQAQQRIDTQIDIEEKIKKASYVIDNSGTLTALKEKTLRILEEIQKDFI